MRRLVADSPKWGDWIIDCATGADLMARIGNGAGSRP